jgi:hypothetical protein
MGKTKKLEIRICLWWLRWKNFTWQHWMFFARLFTLCSARDSAFVIVLSESPCERTGKWETCPILKEDIVGLRLAGASVIKTNTLLGYGKKQLLRLCRRARIMRRQHQRRGTVGGKQHSQGCFEKSQNYCSIGDRRTEYSFWRPCFQKKSDVKSINPTSMVGLITESNAEMRQNGGVTTIKPGHQTTGNARVIWSEKLAFTLFPTWRAYVWRTPKEAYNPECLVPTVKHGGGSVMAWAAVWWHSILLVSLLPFMTVLLQRSPYVYRLSYQVHPMVPLFPNYDADFQDDNVPIHRVRTVQSGHEEHEGEHQHFPG